MVLVHSFDGATMATLPPHCSYDILCPWDALNVFQVLWMDVNACIYLGESIPSALVCHPLT
jgi:hypothetical protein